MTVLSATELKELHVFPSKVILHHKGEEKQFLIQGKMTDGSMVDLTASAKREIKPAGLIHEKNGLIQPIKDGKTEITFHAMGKSVKMNVETKGSAKGRAMSFIQDVVPALTKAGCNTGGCHGASSGQDGFNLSLFGFDPDTDYHNITRQSNGRRILMAAPEKSLLLTKAVGKVQHTGGDMMKVGDKNYNKILTWLKEGALKDPKDLPEPETLEVFPKKIVLNGEGKTHRIIVRARYPDGHYRDVTEVSYFLSSNQQKVKVSPNGVVSSKQGGESFILIRMATLTAGIPVIVIPNNRPEVGKLSSNNYVDDYINSKLTNLKVKPSKLSDDKNFIRRVTLDISGRLPTDKEFTDFLKNENPKKRSQLIDRLLEEPGFIDLWALKWAELLQIRSVNNQFSYKSALLYNDWLKKQLKAGETIDNIVNKILTSKGSTFKAPATNYFQIERDTLKRAENVAQVFMGTRIQCAQCHNHPFDTWTQDDYYGFAAFFSRIGMKRGEDPREYLIYDKTGGEVKHPVKKVNMKPKFLGGEVSAEATGSKRRLALANWLTSTDNPYFARNLANMIWAQYMGRGIVDPVDDQRLSNPASHPELLDQLSSKLVDYKFDFKNLVRDICNSKAYQRGDKEVHNKGNDRLFAYRKPKRIKAEVLLDSIAQVTEVDSKFKGLPLGEKAVNIADGNSSTYFLSTFGRAKRESVCSCEVKSEPNLSQALHLLNGENTHGKVKSSKVIQELMNEKKNFAQILELLFVKTISRYPNETEKKHIESLIKEDRKNEKEILTNVFWALLNSKEFIFAL
jgi:hypothetical protein